MEDVVTARHVPEDDVRDLVAVIPELLSHLLVESPVLVTAVVDLHIGDDDEGLGHLIGSDVVRNCDIQHPLESRLQVRIHLPVVHVDAAELLRKSVTLEDLDPGCAGEGHEHVVVRACVPLGEVHCKADGRCQRPAVHGAGSVRDDQCVGALVDVVGKLAPLSFQRVVFPDPAGAPAHLHDLLHDVVRVQCRGVDRLLTLHCLGDELAVAISVVLHERLAVDHHSPGRHCGVLDLIPAAGGHQGLYDADVLSHGADQALELVYGVAELLRCQDTDLPCPLGRSVSRLDPLCQKRDRVALLKICAVLFELLLHGRPHLVLHGSADQAVHVVISAVHTDQVHVETKCLRVVFCHVLEKRAECLSLAQAAPYVARIEGDLCCEQGIGLPGFCEQTLNALFLRCAEGTGNAEEIQSRVSCGIKRHCAVFSSCEYCCFLSCFCE